MERCREDLHGPRARMTARRTTTSSYAGAAAEEEAAVDAPAAGANDEVATKFAKEFRTCTIEKDLDDTPKQRSANNVAKNPIPQVLGQVTVHAP